MMRRLRLASLIILTCTASGCVASYKPAVDMSKSDASQAQHDADLANCRTQASNLSLARAQANPTRTFGANSPTANQASSADEANPGDIRLISQPNGLQKFLDVCMQRKGYKLSN